MVEFLSQSWFDEVAKLNEAAGDLHLSPSLANLVINLSVLATNPVHLHLKQGKLFQHHADDAVSTITLDKDTLDKVLNDNDVNIAIEAFMTGKIRIDGDMTQVMALQSAKPSQEQKALYKKIIGMTKR